MASDDNASYWLGAQVELDSYWVRGSTNKGTIIGTDWRNGVMLFHIQFDDDDGSNPYSGVTVPRKEFWRA